MSVTTINSFPAFHSYKSSRAWVLAFIVLLHAGFFWALSQGFVGPIIELPRTAITDFIPAPPKPQPPPRDQPVVEVQNKMFVPESEVPRANFDEQETAPLVNTTSVPPPVVTPRGGDVVEPAPVIVEPRIDARRGLSEPAYPPSEIRAQHEGTVLLSVLVLTNGRVGDVKLDRSSGYPKLDESAMREARQWRLAPGTRNGQAVQMWKRIPITFQLKDQ